MFTIKIKYEETKMRLTESTLRRIIRSVIKETIDYPEYESLHQMPDASYMPAKFQRKMYRKQDTDAALNKVLDHFHNLDYDDESLMNPVVQKEMINICKSCGCLDSCSEIIKDALIILGHEVEGQASSYYNKLLAPFKNLQ